MDPDLTGLDRASLSAAGIDDTEGYFVLYSRGPFRCVPLLGEHMKRNGNLGRDTHITLPANKSR